jgi:acyl dehydratase
MKVYATLADLAAEQGRELGVSSWIDVPQGRIDGFADATGDHQWIHVDPKRTQAELGMKPIAHGYLSLSMIPAFMFEVFRVEGAKRVINYGTNKVRFTSMVPVDSRLRGRIKLKDADLSNGALRTILEATVEIDGQEKPAVVAEVIMLFYE